MKFWSWRMLPGQASAWRASSASGASVAWGRPLLAPCAAQKWAARGAMSEARVRSGGIHTGTTLSR